VKSRLILGATIGVAVAVAPQAPASHGGSRAYASRSVRVRGNTGARSAWEKAYLALLSASGSSQGGRRESRSTVAQVVLQVLSRGPGSPSLDRISAANAAGAFGPKVSHSQFRGSCKQYRSSLWTVTQQTSNLLDAYLSALNADYGQYPVPGGGSTPGPTTGEFSNAASDSIKARVLIRNDWGQSGLLQRTVQIARSYGVTQPWNSGGYNYAAEKLYLTQWDLDNAANGETIFPNDGVYYFADAIKQLDWTWPALKQLPC
jgi:hypothetical protein